MKKIEMNDRKTGNQSLILVYELSFTNLLMLFTSDEVTQNGFGDGTHVQVGNLGFITFHFSDKVVAAIRKSLDESVPSQEEQFSMGFAFLT